MLEPDDGDNVPFVAAPPLPVMAKLSAVNAAPELSAMVTDGVGVPLFAVTV